MRTVKEGLKQTGCIVLNIPFWKSIIYGVEQIKITHSLTSLKVGNKVFDMQTTKDILGHSLEDVDCLVDYIVKKKVKFA